jgi:phage shock protein A
MAKTDMEKLQILIEHWIEHNEEHADEFMKWAERAKSAGNEAIYDDILKAIEKLHDANENLRAALKRIG